MHLVKLEVRCYVTSSEVRGQLRCSSEDRGQVHCIY